MTNSTTSPDSGHPEPIVEELQARIRLLEDDLSYYRDALGSAQAALDAIGPLVDLWRASERRRDAEVRG